MTTARSRLRGLLTIGLVATATSGCLVEYPYQTGRSTTPFSVTLNTAEPVVVQDLGATVDALPYNGTATVTLRLADVDPRVRIATTRLDVPGATGTMPIGRFEHPVGNGEYGIEVASLPSSGKPSAPLRVFFERTDAGSGEPITISGTVETAWGYPGSSPLPGDPVTVTGFDRASRGRHSVESRASGPAPRSVLDVDHPIRLQPYRLELHSLAAAEPATAIGETVIRPSAGSESIAFLDDPVAPTFDYQGLIQGKMEIPTVAMHPFAGCSLEPDRTCTSTGTYRLVWQGPGPTTAAWSVDTLLAGFGAAGLPEVRVDAMFLPAVAVPDGADGVDGHYEGTMRLDRGSPDGRATARLRMQVDDIPQAPNPSIVVVPGTVLLTISATSESRRPAPSDRLPRLRISGPIQPLPALLDVRLDGQPHPVGLGLFAGCRPGHSCTADFFFELFPGYQGEDALPVTLTYVLDARLTAFDTQPFPTTTTITLGPQPGR